jgi:hypothetical protein
VIANTEIRKRATNDTQLVIPVDEAILHATVGVGDQSALDRRPSKLRSLRANRARRSLGAAGSSVSFTPPVADAGSL